MSFPVQFTLGITLIVAGAALALFLPEAHFLVFTGRPLGIVLVIVGVVDVIEAVVRRSRADSTSSVR